MSMNGEVVKLIAELVRLQDRSVKLLAKIDNVREELKQKFGVVL